MAIRTPNLDIISVTDTGNSLPAAANFSPRPGALYLFNSGSNPCWITFNGTAPTASDGTGRIRILSNQGFSLEDAEILRLRAITAGGLTTTLQVVYMERPTATSTGF